MLACVDFNWIKLKEELTMTQEIKNDLGYYHYSMTKP